MSDDFPILAAVAASPGHSFQVLEHLQSLGVRATRSTLYRRVETLVDQGLLDAEDTRGERGHVRRELRLTAAGERQIAMEAAKVLRSEPLESPLFALALGCTQAGGTDGLPNLLRPRMAAAARRLTEEERALRSEGAEEAPWGQVARERRIAHLQTDIAWLQSILGRRIVEKTEPAGTLEAG